MFPIPATSDWSSSVSPNQRVPSGARSRSSISSMRGGRSRMSGPSRAERARVQLEHRAVPEDALGPLAAQHEPRLAARAARRAGARVQRPVMPQVRAQRRRRPRSGAPGSCRAPSPTRARWPSIRSATRSACARGCGDSAAIRWPTSACRRRAARWRRVALGHASNGNGMQADCCPGVVLTPSLNIAALTKRTGVPAGHDPQVGAALRRPAPRADRRAASGATASSTSRASNG